MIDPHLTSDAIDRLLAGTLPRTERRHMARHLLAGCGDCRARVREAAAEVTFRDRQIPLAAYEEPVSRVFRQVADSRADEELVFERIAAPGLAAMLTESNSLADQKAMIRNDKRFQTWGLAEQLAEDSQAAVWSAHPDKILELAEAAAAVAEHLSAARYGEARLNDLKASAYGCLGNARRNRAEFAAARRSLETAYYLLRQGVGDPIEEARLVNLEASLLTDQGYFEQAIELIDRAIAIYETIHDSHFRARAQVKKAIALGSTGDAMGAVELLAQAEPAIDRAEDPRLFLCARHNRIWFLTEAGQSFDALMLFHESRTLFANFPDSWSRLRKRWLEARIAAGLGKFEEAEAALGQLWTAAFTRGLKLEVALISLDLAAVHVRLGKHAHAWRLAGRLIPLFKSWGVHRRALEAWALLQHAFAAESATVELVHRIAAYLRRGWRNPEIPFQREG